MAAMRRVIEPREWQGRATVRLARSLLGKVLVRTTSQGRVEHVIVETEAYHGTADRASHASKGRTARTEVMFAPGGCWYVYLCYGMHEMLNLVTGPADFPAAVLVRGVELVSGPGRLTRRLGIGRGLNGLPVVPESGLHLEDHSIVAPARHIIAGPRVGVDYAGPVWAAKPWRFRIEPQKLRRPGAADAGRVSA